MLQARCSRPGCCVRDLVAGDRHVSIREYAVMKVCHRVEVAGSAGHWKI
jgi:hypothetical protein